MAWDRLLLQKGKPQWYGTQYGPSKETGKVQLLPVDETAVTDEERRSLGLPTLAEARATVPPFK